MSTASRPAGLLLLVVATAALTATTTATTTAQRFTARVDVVRVDVLVTDRGKVVRGLSARDFEVRDNNVPQQVDLIGQDEIPINAVLALDLSDSVVGERLVHLRRAGHALVGALRPADQSALIGFSHLLLLGSTLTHDFDKVRDAIDQTATVGNTSLADACFASLILGESDPGRALVLVFSDGSDTSSWLTTDAVLDTARRSDAVVYGISTSPANPSAPKPRFLRDVATATGGSVIEVESTKDLSKEFLRVLDEFRLRYLLSFTPRGVSKDGFHRLEVKVKGRNFKIKARPGYLAR